MLQSSYFARVLWARRSPNGRANYIKTMFCPRDVMRTSGLDLEAARGQPWVVEELKVATIYKWYIFIFGFLCWSSHYWGSIITISNSKSAMERVSEQGSKSPSGRHLNPVIKWPQLQSRLSLSIPPKEHPPKTSKDFQRSTLQYLQLLFGYLYSGWQGQIHLNPLLCWKSHNFC